MNVGKGFDRRIKEYTDDALGMIVDGYTEKLRMVTEECESPIEHLLAVVLVYGWVSDASCIVGVRPQVPIGKYRVDFMVYCDGGITIAVECDGHDYHERTKEQAAADKAKDRALQAAGYLVARFTGSEIWKDPYACLSEIEDMAAGCWATQRGVTDGKSAEY